MNSYNVKLWSYKVSNAVHTCMDSMHTKANGSSRLLYKKHQACATHYDHCIGGATFPLQRSHFPILVKGTVAFYISALHCLPPSIIGTASSPRSFLCFLMLQQNTNISTVTLAPDRLKGQHTCCLSLEHSAKHSVDFWRPFS